MADSDRAHEATPLRLRRARQEGQIARSEDLAFALSLAGGLLLLLWMGGGLLASLGQLIREPLEQANLSRESLLSQVALAPRTVAMMLAPLLVGCLAVTVTARLLQGGWVWAPNKLAPDFSRITPSAGWAQIFSTESTSRTLMAAVKTATVLSLAAGLLWQQRFNLAALGSHSIADAGEILGRTITRFGLQIAGCLTVLGLLDYLYQRWQFSQRLQMSDSERREELRAIEGDPQLIPHRRRLHQEILGAEATLPTAPRQVVLFNAQDHAVLLECRSPDQHRPSAVVPLVVATLHGTASRQLIARSQRDGIPLIEQPQLSRRDLNGLVPGQPLPTRQTQAIDAALRHALRHPIAQ